MGCIGPAEPHHLALGASPTDSVPMAPALALLGNELHEVPAPYGPGAVATCGTVLDQPEQTPCALDPVHDGGNEGSLVLGPDLVCRANPALDWSQATHLLHRAR